MIKGKKILGIIPARGGSKGIPGKNIKKLKGRPLIQWTYDAANSSKFIDKLILSSDNDDIIEESEKIGLEAPFKRPSYLSTDKASTKDVLIHAVNFFRGKKEMYDYIVLLQPTSPFRKTEDIDLAIKLACDNQVDMVVSVKESHSNPYYNLFEECDDGYLNKSKEGEYFRRQDCPVVYEYNGSLYVINVNSLISQNTINFTKKIKYLMKEEYLSIDLDTEFDWKFAEFIVSEFNL